MPALLFDLDGTLIYSDELHHTVFAEMFKERGKKFDLAEFKRIAHLY